MKVLQRYQVWHTAIACFALQGLGMALLGLYGFFVGPLGEQFGADATTMALGMAIMLLLTAVMSPILGAVLDRTAIKPILLFGVCWVSLSLWMMARTDSLPGLTGWFISFLVGVICYGPLTCNVLVIKAYTAHRGRALAIAAMGVSISAITLPPLVAWLLETTGWRGALSAVAVIVALVLIPMVLLFVEEPRRIALTPAETSTGQSGSGEFLRQRQFWLLGIGMAIFFNAMILTSAVLVPHFLDLGMARTDAATIFALGGVAGLAGKLCFAAVSASIRPYVKHLAMGLALLQLVGWWLITNADGYNSALIGNLVVGASSGIIIPFYPYINSVYFDEAIIGRVNGAQAPLFLPLGLAAAPLAGMAFDSTGSYAPAFLVVVGFMVAVFTLFAFLPKPPPVRSHDL